MEKTHDKFDDIAQKAWLAILDAVRQMKNTGMTLDDIAKKLGIKNRALVGEWLNENRVAVNTSFPTMLRYLDAIGRSIHEFIEDSTPTIRRIEPNAPTDLIIGEDLKTIQVYASAGAGTGQQTASLIPLFSVTAPPTYFYQCDFAVAVDGHSMEPTIPHNAVVGVRKIENFKLNELYVANIPYEGLVVKRVAVDMQSNEFIFKLDNPNKEAYPDFRIDIESAWTIIQGRVVWVMRGY